MTRAAATTLYRQFLREGVKFKDYNMRSFAKRRARNYFEDNRALTDPEKLQNAFAHGQTELTTLQRQVTVQNLYHHQSSIMDSFAPKQ